MKLLSAIRFAVALSLLSMLMVATGLSQSFKESAPLASGVPTPPRPRAPEIAVRAFPRVDLGSQRQLKYVGSYSADGKFRALSKLDRLLGRAARATPQAATPQVPPFVQLGTSERLVEDFESPGRAVNVAKGHSALAEARDGLIRLVYGRENVLRTPRHVTTDSRQRLIISDPAVPAIHVLDTRGKRSFRIVGGPGRRLRLPSGAAVDGEDNIYVADSERGMVFVYGPDGSFLRHIGNLGGGEGLFHYPTSIAIDRKAGHLYVLDSPRLFMLDLQGKFLNRIGRSRGGTGEFTNPTDIALSPDELLVLDADGSRVEIMDLQCRLLRRLSLPNVLRSQETGLGVDSFGNIYVSFASASMVRVYNHDAALLSSFGYEGIRIGEFNSPTGLWLDSTNHIYVADTGNVRVQVFQLGVLNAVTQQVTATLH
ncbi:MAG TPA: 6-bladed beta-propeller [Terriglobales bacterium]|nr:6-bladed beta-propeller [Terriglobales bacterium]